MAAVAEGAAGEGVVAGAVAAGAAVAEGAAGGTGIVTFGAATGAGEGTSAGEGDTAVAVDGGATAISGATAIRVFGGALDAAAAIMRADRVGCEGASVEGAASRSFGWGTAFRSSSDATDD